MECDGNYGRRAKKVAVMADDVEIREYTSADRADVVALMRQALGERSGERTEEFFSWKHERNAFGASAAWVALDQGVIVGFRALMRWEFTSAGRTVRAVRAVDTSTAPSHQGKGIFRRLTLHGLDVLRSEGVEFVFNTPNGLSRPGYLKMGWQVIGRLPTRFRPARPSSLIGMARAKVPAELWSVPTEVGLSIDEWVSKAEPLVESVAGQRRAASRLQTAMSTEFLRWRYGFEPLSYRVWPLGSTPDAGGIVFRLRRRGPLVEAAILDVLAPTDAMSGRHLRRLLRAAGADYALSLGANGVRGLLPLPKQGPTLTARSVAGESPSRLSQWSLGLGDVELF
jgi:predicted N-acetyltransferase YhbS